MGLIDSFHGKLVALDASILIYEIEDHPQYAPILHPFFLAAKAGRFNFVASTQALAEVLPLPMRRSDSELINKFYATMLFSASMKLYDVTQEIAIRAARLRADYNLKTPDAIHLATALETGAAIFITNDAEFFRQKLLPEPIDLEILGISSFM